MKAAARAMGLCVAIGVGGASIWAAQQVHACRVDAGPQGPILLRDGPEGAAIWGVWTGRSFAYGIETGSRSVALIDAGSDPDARALIEQLAARGMAPEDVHTIVLTHGHDEVQAGLGMFSRATVYIGAQDWMLARRDVLPGPWLAKLQAKSLRRRRLDKRAMQPMWPGQLLPLQTRKAHLVALPGHTWGSYAVVVEDVAFVGDSVAGITAAAESQGQQACVQGQGLRLYDRRLSVSPKHNAWALRRLVGTGYTQMATTHAGVLPYGAACLAAWLQAQQPAPLPPRLSPPGWSVFSQTQGDGSKPSKSSGRSASSKLSRPSDLGAASPAATTAGNG